MLELYQRRWWTFALRGAAAVFFGLATFVWPGLSLAVLIGLFGAYALVDGTFSIVAAIRRRHTADKVWPLVVEGIIGLMAGVFTWIWPGVTALALLITIAAWAVLTGVLEIVSAIRLRKEIEGEWLLATAGAASLLFGVLLLLRPAAGVLAVLWLIGAYAVVFGVLYLGLSVSLKRGTTGTARPAHA